MNIWKLFSLLFFSLLIHNSKILNAQELPIQFNNIGIEKGLANSTVYEIIQDKKGYLWIGTQNGLSKFDGYSFTTIKTIPFDTLSLANNWIQAVHESKDGSIWIGALNGGISRLDPVSGKFNNYKAHPSNKTTIYNNRIWKIFEDSDSNLWIGTSGSLDKFDYKAKTFTHLLSNELNQIQNGAANSIDEDKEGFIWVATWGSGLFKLDKMGNVIKQYSFSYNGTLTSNKLKVVYLGSDDFIWIGTNQDGLIKFNKKTEKYSFYRHVENDPNSLSHNFVLSIYEDNNDNLWIGTHSGGLNRLDKKTGKFFNYRHDPNDNYSISNNWVSTIYQSKSGTIWVGTDKGISKFILGKQIFHNLQHREMDKNSISSDDIHAVFEDSKGLLWIGTWRKGLNVLNPKTGKIRKYFNMQHDDSSLPDNTVFALYEDKKSNLWVGTYNGLAKYLPKTDNFKVFRNQPNNNESIGFNNITSILDDSYGYLWIGTWDGGLQRMDINTEKFKRYQKNLNTANGLSDMVINCIFEDNNKTLYIGTSSGGLNIYNRNVDSFTVYQNNPSDLNSISNNCISSIIQNINREIWIATLGGGLNKFDPHTKKFIHFYTLPGNSDNTVMSLQNDSLGNIWYTTSHKIAYLDIKNNSIISYDNQDGIINQQFTIASAKGRDGKFIFGGKNGVTFFYPSANIAPLIKPSIEILSVKVSGKQAEVLVDRYENELLELDYTQNDLSITFAVLDYFRTDKINYRYMLEGYQDNWVLSNNQRTAYYTNLDPGRYKFKLIASFENNNWFNREKYLAIIIHPPFWERWWFILISIIFIAALIYSAYWYRMNQLLKIERLRTTIAADLHDEIASNLSGIAMFGKIIQDEKKRENSNIINSEQLLERIITLSQESIISIREIIWAIDVRTETIYDLLVKTNDMIVIPCQAKNINFSFDIPSKELLPSKNLAPNVRKDLWMLLKEALNNSIKHSECNELHLITTYDSQQIRIVINDNGKGFDINKKYSGKGKTNITERAKSLRAVLEMESDSQNGTTIIISFKI